MNWNLWINQTLAVTRLELKRFILARRWIGIYLVAFAPLVVAIIARIHRGPNVGDETVPQAYANVYQFFLLRLALFMSCAVVFSQVFRGEILEKTLHFYLLASVRREIVALGKYFAGVIFVGILFTVSAIGIQIVMYSTSPIFGSYFLDGQGGGHAFWYALVTILACGSYGAIFLLVGLLFKNPGVPAFFLLGWETFSFALPPLLQRLTIIHYLQSMLPVTVDNGVFAIVTEPTPAILAIPALVVGVAILLAISGFFMRFTQVTYSAD